MCFNFKVTGPDEEGKYFMETCPAGQGDYFGFFAEIDALCALSIMPWRRPFRLGLGEQRSRQDVRNYTPLGVEVYSIADPIFWDAGRSRIPLNILVCMA